MTCGVEVTELKGLIEATGMGLKRHVHLLDDFEYRSIRLQVSPWRY